MNVTEIKNKVEKINTLIRLQATGTPKDLAKKLNTTERTVFRIIKQLKEMGCPIYYDKQRGSYCYEEEGKLIFKFEANSIDIETIEGTKKWGGKYFLNFFQTDTPCQWADLALQ